MLINLRKITYAKLLNVLPEVQHFPSSLKYWFCGSAVPCPCRQSAHSLWSGPSPVWRLCIASTPDPTVWAHHPPLTCRGQPTRILSFTTAAFENAHADSENKIDIGKAQATYGRSLPPVTMSPSRNVVYMVNTGPVWALATILTRMCSFHTHTSPLMVPVNVKLFWKENKPALI